LVREDLAGKVDGGSRSGGELAGRIRGTGVDDEDFIDQSAARERIPDDRNDRADRFRFVKSGDADGDAPGFFQSHQCVHIGELPVMKALRGRHGEVLAVPPEACKDDAILVSSSMKFRPRARRKIFPTFPLEAAKKS
jgi:hypothetical protein